MEARAKERFESQDNFRVLALSTGGGWGGFGSGMLEGLTSSMDEKKLADFKFDLVTGASTGSVIAPFAFLGEHADFATASEIYTKELNDANTLSKRHIWDLFTASALNGTSKMRALMLRKVTEVRPGQTASIIDRVAAEARKNRTLAVASVNVDTGLTEIFDLTAIASTPRNSGESDKAYIDRRASLFVDRIMASVAIPIAFDPVFINGCMYQDAGLRQQVFMSGELLRAAILHGAEPIAKKPTATPTSLVVLEPNGRYGPQYEINLKLAMSKQPLGVDVYMLINGTADEEPELDDAGKPGAVRAGILPIGMKDLGLLTNESMWSSITRASLVGKLMRWSIQYRDASDYYLFPQQLGPVPTKPSGAGVIGAQVFDPEKIRFLNNFGNKLGKGELKGAAIWTQVPSGPDIMSPDITRPPPK